MRADGSQFVDTNVLLYAYDASAGTRHDDAAALVAELGRSRSGALSVQVLKEFYVNATCKIAKPLAPDVAADRVRVLGRWRTHVPAVADVLGAIAIHRRYDISFWDAMIVRSASALGCRVLWSEDLNPDQVYDDVRVSSPFS